MPNDPAMIRPARPGDESILLELVRELAEFEKLADTVVAGAADFSAALFGDPPRAGALLAESGGQVVGMAIHFATFSTFTGRSGLWLEDLYVRPAFRGRGIGRALITAILEHARALGCVRTEWSVLDWNEDAIRFYRSLGATVLPDWRIVRIDPRSLGP
jgi:GNAT superfamily N-acetyltransferase